MISAPINHQLIAPQDGKPYIPALHAGPTYEDSGSYGYTFTSKSEFASKADLNYYDFECAAHQTLKSAAKGLGMQGMQTIYYEPAVAAVAKDL
jgi:hypothetical protein